METQKIVNLLNDTDNENSKFAKWYVIDSESKGNYSDGNEIKFLTSSLESNLCDYSDASAAVIIYYIFEQSKETILEFSEGTTKVF